MRRAHRRSAEPWCRFRTIHCKGSRPPDPVAGEFVTEAFEYDGGRQVTVYIPPDPPEAVVFAGDGEGISQWGRDLESADVPPTMIVGVHGLTDEMPRLYEYSPIFDAERFASHEEFFVLDVGRWNTEGWTAERKCKFPAWFHRSSFSLA